MLGSSQKSLWMVIFITSTLLIYVHLQTSVFQVSYSIVHKERKLSQLSDEYRVKKFQVSKLRSLSYLDKRRGEIEVPLVAPEKIEIIRIPVERKMEISPEIQPVIKKGFLSFAGFMREAQAKMSH